MSALGLTVKNRVMQYCDYFIVYCTKLTANYSLCLMSVLPNQRLTVHDLMSFGLLVGNKKKFKKNKNKKNNNNNKQLVMSYPVLISVC